MELKYHFSTSWKKETECVFVNERDEEQFDLYVLRSDTLSLSLCISASYMPGMPAVSPYGPNPNPG